MTKSILARLKTNIVNVETSEDAVALRTPRVIYRVQKRPRRRTGARLGESIRFGARFPVECSRAVLAEAACSENLERGWGGHASYVRSFVSILGVASPAILVSSVSPRRTLSELKHVAARRAGVARGWSPAWAWDGRPPPVMDRPTPSTS